MTVSILLTRKNGMFLNYKKTFMVFARDINKTLAKINKRCLSDPAQWDSESILRIIIVDKMLIPLSGTA